MTPETQAQSPQNTTAQKVFIVGLILWVLAQLIRFIALPLINSINAGVDSVAWMYPAVLDLVCAIFAIPLALYIWKKRSFTIWVLCVIYFTVSIVDHIGALTNLTYIGAPIAFQEMNEGSNPFTAPIVQTVLDVVFMYLLFIPKFRRLFFT